MCIRDSTHTHTRTHTVVLFLKLINIESVLKAEYKNFKYSVGLNAVKLLQNKSSKNNYRWLEVIVK